MDPIQSVIPVVKYGWDWKERVDYQHFTKILPTA